MIPLYKVCPCCQVEKSKDEYHIRNDKGRLHLKSYCKSCSKQCSIKCQYDKCQCGKNKTKKSKQCQQCCIEKQKKFETLGDVKHYYKYGKQVIYQPIRSRARTVIKDRKCCEKCGYEKHVEACHIKPISSFTDDTLIETINSPENILALCPNCHWELDNMRENGL